MPRKRPLESWGSDKLSNKGLCHKLWQIVPSNRSSPGDTILGVGGRHHLPEGRVGHEGSPHGASRAQLHPPPGHVQGVGDGLGRPVYSHDRAGRAGRQVEHLGECPGEASTEEPGGHLQGHLGTMVEAVRRPHLPVPSSRGPGPGTVLQQGALQQLEAVEGQPGVGDDAWRWRGGRVARGSGVGGCGT